MIENIADIKKIFKGLEIPIVGVGVSAFNRLGPSFFIPGYKIVCLYDSKDTALIEGDVDVISVEKITGKRPYQKRKNSTSVLDDENIVKFLNSLPRKPALVIYKVREKLNQICNANGWFIIGQQKTSLEDKILFRRILEKCRIPAIPGIITTLSEADYGSLSKSLGPALVLQLPKRGGGKGTFFINSGDDIEAVKARFIGEETSRVLITRFIPGPSPSITGCVTSQGVVCTNPQYQLLDIPECSNPGVGSGVFCGHDWTSAGKIPDNIQKKAVSYAMKIGGAFKKVGYKGIFGIDFIWEAGSNKLYLVECNPRLLGSFPLLTMIQLANKEIPIIAFHIMEILGLDYKINPKRLNQDMQRGKRGAQLIIYNKYDHLVKNTREIEAGVYKLSNGRLAFQRKSYDLRDLEREEEFLLTDGIPLKDTIFKPARRILRFVTLHSMIDTKTNKLNSWASERVNAVYNALALEEC